jgi:D-glycero-D-manno-heptose 1,7-bisphosphate phosphatase
MKNMEKPLIILDRDGVINVDSPNYIKTPKEWMPIKGSSEAIAKLSHAGYSIVVATNQAGISRGLFTFEDLHAIHAKMIDTLSQYGGTIDAIFFCPHKPEDLCKCRKPQPGLFYEIQKRFKTDLKNVKLIGDSHRDLVAASQAGALPWLVSTGNGKKTIEDDRKGLKKIPEQTQIFIDLSDAVKNILN